MPLLHILIYFVYLMLNICLFCLLMVLLCTFDWLEPKFCRNGEVLIAYLSVSSRKRFIKCLKLRYEGLHIIILPSGIHRYKRMSEVILWIYVYEWSYCTCHIACCMTGCWTSGVRYPAVVPNRPCSVLHRLLPRI